MDSLVTRGVFDTLMVLHSAIPCSNNPSAKPVAPKPSLKTKDAEARTLFFSQLKFANEIALKRTVGTADSSSKDIHSDSGTASTSDSESSFEEPSETPADRKSTIHSRPALSDSKEKTIPPEKLGAAAIIGLQNGRSCAATTLSVVRLAEAGKAVNTGEAITTLVLSGISIVAAIFNAVTAAKNLNDHETKEETLNSVLIRTREGAKAYFENCENKQGSSAEEVRAYVEFIAAVSQHKKFLEKAADSTFLTRLVMAKEAAFLAIAGLGLTQGILLVAAIPVAVISAVVLTALIVGLGLVANGYEIEQGRQGLVAANKRREKAEKIQTELKKILQSNTEIADAEVASGIANFYAKEAQKAENEASFAFMRIVKGIAGVVMAALGAALMFMTGGALAPAVAVLGAASSVPFFAGLATKIYTDIKELQAIQTEKEAWLTLMNADSTSISQSKVDYGNRYIMAHKFAEALVDGPKIEETSGLGKILLAIGFAGVDFQIIAGMQDMKGERNDTISSIMAILAKEMGITL